MIFATQNIELKPGKSLFVVPFGDMQSEEEAPRLKGLVQWLMKRQKQGHRIGMFGMGDYFESPSPSDRAALKASKNGYGMYDDLAASIMDVYETKVQTLVKILNPIKPNIYGLLRGHHFCDFGSPLRPKLPQDSNHLLASLLKTQYWGSTIQLTLNVNSLPFRIFGAHGY